MMYCILNACLKAKSCRTESRIRAQTFHKITSRLYGNLGDYIKGIPPPNVLSVSIVYQRSVTAAAQKRSVIHQKCTFQTATVTSEAQCGGIQHGSKTPSISIRLKPVSVHGSSFLFYCSAIMRMRVTFLGLKI